MVKNWCNVLSMEGVTVRYIFRRQLCTKMWKLCSSGVQSNQIKVNIFMEEIKVQQFLQHHYM